MDLMDSATVYVTEEDVDRRVSQLAIHTLRCTYLWKRLGVESSLLRQHSTRGDYN